MTAAAQPPTTAGAPVRAWRAFRRWRHSRPFWGGLITIISALLYYFSVHLNPTAFTVSFGQQGFLAWLLPLVLLLCGLLAWLTPAQRIFYGVVAAAAAVYGLIAVNLGGFFLGMLVGIVGGALIAAWLPARPAPAPAADEDGTDDGGTEGEPALLDDTTAEQPGLPLRDSADDEIEPMGGRHAVPVVEKSGSRWRHGGRGTALVLVPVALAAVGLLALQHPLPAYAAPANCATVKPTGTPAASATTDHPAAAAPTPTPTASDEHGNPIGDLLGNLVDGVKKLLGAGDPSPSATPAATPTSARPASTAPKTGTPTPKTTCTPRSGAGKPSASPSAAAANATVLAAGADQPYVAGVATLKTATLKMSGLSYDGVYDLPTVGGGSIQTLKFSMTSAAQTPFELDVPAADGRQIVQTSSDLVISGKVEFYCTRFAGWLLDAVKLTFTPDAPPPLVLPEMTFNRAELWLVYVHADKLVAPDFGNIAGT